MIVILPCIRSISVSFRHLGQYRGKFLNSVSSLIFTLVLPPQIGHFIHIVPIVFIMFSGTKQLSRLRQRRAWKQQIALGFARSKRLGYPDHTESSPDHRYCLTSAPQSGFEKLSFARPRYTRPMPTWNYKLSLFQRRAWIYRQYFPWPCITDLVFSEV